MLRRNVEQVRFPVVMAIVLMEVGAPAVEYASGESTLDARGGRAGICAGDPRAPSARDASMTAVRGDIAEVDGKGARSSAET